MYAFILPSTHRKGKIFLSLELTPSELPISLLTTSRVTIPQLTLPSLFSAIIFSFSIAFPPF